MIEDIALKFLFVFAPLFFCTVFNILFLKFKSYVLDQYLIILALTCTTAASFSGSTPDNGQVGLLLLIAFGGGVSVLIYGAWYWTTKPNAEQGVENSLYESLFYGASLLASQFLLYSAAALYFNHDKLTHAGTNLSSWDSFQRIFLFKYCEFWWIWEGCILLYISVKKIYSLIKNRKKDFV